MGPSDDRRRDLFIFDRILTEPKNLMYHLSWSSYAPLGVAMYGSAPQCMATRRALDILGGLFILV